MMVTFIIMDGMLLHNVSCLTVFPSMLQPSSFQGLNSNEYLNPVNDEFAEGLGNRTVRSKRMKSALQEWCQYYYQYLSRVPKKKEQDFPGISSR